MKYGLTDAEIDKICQVFSQYEKVEKVILYGSRAKGTYKPFSDVDITLVGENLTRSDLNAVVLALDDLLLSYEFDVSILSQLKNDELMEHILRVGVTIYDKGDE